VSLPCFDLLALTRQGVTLRTAKLTYECRVERYTSDPLPPQSPALSTRTNTTSAAAAAAAATMALPDPRQQPQQSQAPTAGSSSVRPLEVQMGSPTVASIPTSSSQSQLYTGSVSALASPMLGSMSGSGVATPTAVDAGARDIHLSGHEPRYFPGLVSRNTQRKDSMRKESGHESDPSR
jgi:AMP deaminase